MLTRRRNSQDGPQGPVGGVIRSIRHRGLQRLHRHRDASRLPPDKIARIGRILNALETADGCRELACLHGLHPLRGNRAGIWAVPVSGNWRVVFRLAGRDVLDLNLVDYH